MCGFKKRKKERMEATMKSLFFLTILAATVSVGLATRVMCHYTNWSRYGSQPFKIEDIDPTLCTHIIYSFLGLDEGGNVKSLDPWNDFGDEWTEGGLKRFIRLKNRNPSVKLLIGVGGWSEGPLKFQSMVRNPEKRKTFLVSALTLIRNFAFDGLEIDWIYQDAYGGTPADKAGFSQLVKEMKPKFEENGYVLGIATSANPRVFENSYDISTLSAHVDYITMMSYDLHGSWDKKTGHVAPLHAMKTESPENKEMNVEAVVNRHIKHGAIPEKLNVGLVTYGRTFTLIDPNNWGLNAPTSGPGTVDPLPYRTFCVQNQQNIWKLYRNEEQAIPYGVAGNQWVGYEDVTSLSEKIKFCKNKKLKGVSVWSLDFDDFNGVCNSGRFPLLRVIYEGMFS